MHSKASFAASPGPVFHFAIACLLLAFQGCGKSGGVSKEYLAKNEPLFRDTFNMDVERSRLCVFEGPFPREVRPANRDRCEKCEALLAAGLVSQEFGEDSYGRFERYTLTPQGMSAYRDDTDRQALDGALKQWEARGGVGDKPDSMGYARPRLCLGTERYHSMVAVLPPMSMGGNSAVSAKVISEVVDANLHLWEPKMAGLGLTIPPKPEPGKPVLYPPRVITFMILPDWKQAYIDDMRYGPWVNEE